MITPLREHRVNKNITLETTQKIKLEITLKSTQKITLKITQKSYTKNFTTTEKFV